MDLSTPVAFPLPSPHTHGLTEVPEAQECRNKVLGILNRHHNLASALEHLDRNLEELESLQPPEVIPRPLFIHLAHGLAWTTGSALGQTPPSTQECLEAYEVPNKVGLTAGSKAWSKHAHRSLPPASSPPQPPEPDAREIVQPEIGVAQADPIDVDSKPLPRKPKKKKEPKPQGWWGNPTGPISQINEGALVIFWRIMNNATWRNLHWLPHQVLVYEIRVQEGYGMRWSRDLSGTDDGDGQDASEGGNGDENQEGSLSGRNVPLPPESGVQGETAVVPPRPESRLWIFRGFLEPQMENGHEVGWRHPV